ncbi:MAG: protein kinase [Candidatus Methylacidiphilales bacterium]
MSTSDLEAGEITQARYDILSTLGSGGMGSVYCAWDNELERTVAIKRLFASENETSSAEEAWREARTMAALQHANIVTLYDFGQDASGPYFIMEYIHGHTLDQKVSSGQLPDESELLDVARQVLSGLVAAHERGIIHRDLKSGNIMVTETPTGDPLVKILDFGLARFQNQPSEQTLTADGSFMGSIYFAAPEQLRRQPLDQRTDLYSFGHVLYHYATGHHAFEAEGIEGLIAAHLTESARPLARVRHDLSPEFCLWIHQLMEREPEQRPASSRDALDALKTVARTLDMAASRSLPLPKPTPPGVQVQQAHHPSSAPLPTKPRFTITNPVPPTNTTPWGWIAASVLLLVALGATAFMMLRPAAPPTSASTISPPPAPQPATSLDTIRRELPPESRASNVSRSVPVGAIAATDLESLKNNLNRSITVSGIPVSVTANRPGTAFYLNFASNYREALSVVCFIDRDPDGFQRPQLEKWIGQNVTVTGTIEHYRGAYQIQATSLDQIKQAR